ncbi:hypothetical protein ACP4OV_011095 [Aristida adscensionis]
MDKEAKQAPAPAPDAALRAVRCARASLLIASLRRSRAPPPPDRRSSSASSFAADAAAEGTPRDDRLVRGEAAVAVSAARGEAAGNARLAGSELLLVLALPPLLLLVLLLGLLAAPASAVA